MKGDLRVAFLLPLAAVDGLKGRKISRRSST